MKKRKFQFSLCTGVVLLILVSICAYGQTYQSFRLELQRINERPLWRFGPFKIDPSIEFQNIGYDNNIFQMSDKDDPIGDWTATISIPFNFYLPYRNWMIAYFDFSPGYDFYFNENRLSGFIYSYSPGIRLLLLNRFVLSGSYQRRKDRERPTVEFDERIPVQRESYDASLFYETYSLTAFGFTGSVRNIYYEDIEGNFSYYRQLNREERKGNIEFYYRIFTESDFFVTAGYTDYRFKSPESQWRDSYSYELMSGIRFPLLGRARGTLSLGYRWLTNREDGSKKFSGFIGNTGLEFRLGRFNFRILMARDFQFSISTSSLYFVGDRYGTGISFYVAPFLRLDYDFSYGRTDYPEEELTGTTREDIYRTHSVGLVFRIKENVGIGLTANYWERRSNFEDFGRNRTFIGGYLTYDF